MSWVAGFNNTVSDASTPHSAYGHLVLGGDNKVTPGTSDSRSCTIGFNNTTYGGRHNCVFGVINTTSSIEDYLIGGGNRDNGSYGSNFLCGLDNNIPNTNRRGGIYLYGQNLHITKTQTGPQHLVVVGKGSNATINVSNSKNTLGAAITGGGSANFNIECYPAYTKLDLPLRLPTDETQVNAIDPPQDPTNPTTNEQTLATLGSLHTALTSYTMSTAIINSHVTITPQSPTLTLNTPPTWCRYLQVTVRLAGAHQTINVDYNPAPSIPHTNFGITRHYWISSDNKLRTVWCEFDYENATNTITWTNYVVWDIDFTTGTATKLYAGLEQYEGGYPLNIVSVIALA